MDATPLTFCLSSLAQTTRFLWQAQSLEEEKSWARNGQGLVTSNWTKGQLHLSAKGSWTDVNHSKPIHFTTVWIFTPDPDSEPVILQLGHGRSGSLQPLVALTPRSPFSWESKEDHLCGEDRYHARLIIEPEPMTITLEWKVAGPQKSYHLKQILS